MSNFEIIFLLGRVQLHILIQDGRIYTYTLQKSRNLPICVPSLSSNLPSSKVTESHSNLCCIFFLGISNQQKTEQPNPPRRSKSQISHHFNKWHALDLSKFQWSQESHPSAEALPVWVWSRCGSWFIGRLLGWRANTSWYLLIATTMAAYINCTCESIKVGCPSTRSTQINGDLQMLKVVIPYWSLTARPLK